MFAVQLSIPSTVSCPQLVGLALAWILFAAVALSEASRGLSRTRRADSRWLLVIFLAGLVLRLALATWGPGDDQMRHRQALSDCQGCCSNFHLGGAPLVLWEFFFLFMPPNVDVIFGVTVLLSALAPLLLAAALRQLGAAREASLGAGIMLAIQPLVVRFGGEMNRVSLVLFLGAATIWALARYWRSPRPRYLVGFVAAAWLCCRSRPEAGLILPVSGFVVLFVLLSSLGELRERRFWGLVAAFAVAGILGVGHLALGAMFEPAITEHLGAVEAPAFVEMLDAPWLDLRATSGAVIALAGLGLVYGVLLRRTQTGRAATWAALSLILLAWLTPPGYVGPDALAYSRYHGLPFLAFSTLGGVGVWFLAVQIRGQLPGRWRAIAFAGIALAVLVTSIQPMWAICRPRIVDYEFHFLYDALPELPEGAIIYRPFKVERDFVGGFRDPDTISHHVGDARWHDWPPTGDEEGGPAYFYVPPACFVDPEQMWHNYPESAFVPEHCRQGLARSDMSAGLTTEVPALPYCGERFTAPRFTIGFYPLREEE